MLRATVKKGAVFLDRDGVINASPKGRYVTRWGEFRFLPGSLKALQRLHAMDWPVVVISNQSGVGRGMMTKGTLEVVTRKMLEVVARRGGRIDAVYYCTHAPDHGCSCRKPSLRLMKQAARRLHVDLKHSFMVGDNRTDIEMGRRARCKTVLVLSGRESKKALLDPLWMPDHVAKNLSEAVRWIARKG